MRKKKKWHPTTKHKSCSKKEEKRRCEAQCVERQGQKCHIRCRYSHSRSLNNIQSSHCPTLSCFLTIYQNENHATTTLQTASQRPFVVPQGPSLFSFPLPTPVPFSTTTNHVKCANKGHELKTLDPKQGINLSNQS